MIEKTRSRPAVKIDKSVLSIGEPERIRDKPYRDSAKHRNCMACELAGRVAAPGTVVLAHINIAGNFGRGLKAGDDESVFLCDPCHRGSEADTDGDRAKWLVRNILIPMRKKAYRNERMALNGGRE